MVSSFISMMVSLMILDQAPTAERPSTSEKKVCRREDNTGSILVKKTCHSRSEWVRIDGDRRRAADDAMRSRGPVRPNSGVDR